MKRHEALAPLSRAHHSTLILARLLRKDAPMFKGLPSNVKDKAQYALQQFNEVIKKHFQQEETILEKVRDCHADIKSLSEEIVKEHQQLTALFISLKSESEPVESMNKLGVALENHIRKEERVLFPLLQIHCPETLLQQIYIVLH